MKRIARIFLSFFFLTFASVAFALESPVPMLQNVSDQMIQALKAKRASMRKDPTEVYGIVDKILVPHADLQAMARSALGRDAWMSATPQQQSAFVEAFKNLMVHTYGAGLSSYTDETVQFDKLREGELDAGNGRIEIRSKILRTDGPPISVTYRLIYKQGDWLVYDFSVEGISMVQSFRSQFASELSSGMSLDALTQKLNQHNAGNSNA